MFRGDSFRFASYGIAVAQWLPLTTPIPTLPLLQPPFQLKEVGEPEEGTQMGKGCAEVSVGLEQSREAAYPM